MASALAYFLKIVIGIREYTSKCDINLVEENGESINLFATEKSNIIKNFIKKDVYSDSVNELSDEIKKRIGDLASRIRGNRGSEIFNLSCIRVIIDVPKSSMLYVFLTKVVNLNILKFDGIGSRFNEGSDGVRLTFFLYRDSIYGYSKGNIVNRLEVLSKFFGVEID